MTDIAKALEETAIVDVAACYAAQPRRNPKPVTPTEPPATIVQLIELGDPSRNIPCAACHRRGPGSSIETPNLSEQRQHCLAVEGVCLWRTPKQCIRTQATIAAILTPIEIEGLVAYYRNRV
jgi:hypothetical protein